MAGELRRAFVPTWYTKTMSSQPANELLIDKIVYLASLVSDPMTIGQKLDRMRGITAAHTRGTALSNKDTATLENVYGEIEQYLISQDPQRVFTAEELRQRVVERFELKGHITRLRKKLLTIALLVAAFGGLSLLVPVPATQDEPLEFYLRLAIPTVFTILHLGAAWLFLSALRNFRATFKTAYRLIAGGIVALGLAQLQLVVLGLLDLWSDPWVTIGIISVIFSVAFCLIFYGIRMVGAPLGVRNLATSPMTIAFCILVACVLVVISPHYPAPVSELYVDIGSAGLAIAAVLATTTSIAALSIRRQLSALYKQPLGALAVALGLMAVAGLQFLFIQLVLGYHNWYEDSGLAYLPLLLAALAFVRAGYLFSKVSDH